MHANTIRLVEVCALVTLLASCENEEPTQQAGSTLVAAPALAAFEARWRVRSAGEVQQRSRLLAEILLGRPMEAAALTGLRATGAQTWSQAKVGNDLLVGHFPKADDLRVSNALLAAVVDGPDIGEAEARKAFDAAYAKMVSSGLVNVAHFDTRKVSVTHTRFGIAPAGQQAVPRVTEYIFSMLRQINGIDFANAGVRIAVHRSGRLSWIRLGGAEVASVRKDGADVPTARGFTFLPAVAPSTLEARFVREVPNAHRAWGRTMYVLPEEVESAVIEPKYVLSFARKSMMDGREVKSRREMLAYSLRSAASAAEDLTGTRQPAAVGDPRPR
jgi:hypothetical protein